MKNEKLRNVCAFCRSSCIRAAPTRRICM